MGWGWEWLGKAFRCQCTSCYLERGREKKGGLGRKSLHWRAALRRFLPATESWKFAFQKNPTLGKNGSALVLQPCSIFSGDQARESMASTWTLGWHSRAQQLQAVLQSHTWQVFLSRRETEQHTPMAAALPRSSPTLYLSTFYFSLTASFDEKRLYILNAVKFTTTFLYGLF